MHLQNGGTAFQIRQLHRDAPVEPAGTQQSLVQCFRAVGGRQNNYTLAAVKTVHLGEQLVQGLLPFVVAAADAGSIVTAFANGIDLVDEHDAGGLLRGLLEQVTHSGRAHAHEHLHKFGTGDAEEGHARLTGDRLGQQGFTGTRRAHQQRTLGQGGADAVVLAGVMQKVHDLGQGFLGFVLPGHVREGLAGLGLHIHFRIGFAEAHGVGTTHPLHHKAHEQLAQQHHEQHRQHHAEQQVHDGRGLGGDHAAVLHLAAFGIFSLQQPFHAVRVIDPRGLIDPLLAVFIQCLIGDGAIGRILLHHAHLTLFQIGDEAIVAHLGHRSAHDVGEHQRIEQKQDHHRGHIVINQCLFGIFGSCRFHIHSAFFKWYRFNSTILGYIPDMKNI